MAFYVWTFEGPVFARGLRLTGRFQNGLPFGLTLALVGWVGDFGIGIPLVARCFDSNDFRHGYTFTPSGNTSTRSSGQLS